MMSDETLGWVLAGGGWLVVAALSIMCFRASRGDGDHTPQGNMARTVAFIAGGVFTLLALMPLAELMQHWWEGTLQQ